VLLACRGTVGEPGSAPNPIDDPPFVTPDACRPGDTPDAELLRVARSTYLSALEALVGSAPLDVVRTNLEGLPITRSGTYSSELPPPSFAEVSAYQDIAAALAFELTKDAASLSALSPCLGTLAGAIDPATDACLGGFVDEFGTRLLRAPVSAEDRARFLDAYSIGGGHSPGEGVATMLMTMLLDPRFLYFFEVDGAEIRPGVLALTDHELAARLARVLWDSIPDADLLAAADAGFDDATLAAEVERMWLDPRARGAMSRFYREWLEIETLPYPPDAFAADAASRDALRDAMREDVLQLAEAVTFDREGSYRDLLLDSTGFIESPALARIYGLDPSASGEVTLAGRAGVLTRSAWLATTVVQSSNAGHIIKRGARFGRFFCDELPPPDPNVFPADDPADPAGATVAIRERFQAVTSEPQCALCHEKLDAFGAPFGNFGSVGQLIDGEEVTIEGSTMTLPIDTASTLSLDGADVPVSNAIELSEALAASDQAVACFATHVTRNIVGRRLRGGDACLVKAARDVLRRPDSDPGSIREAILQLLVSTEFSTRTVPR
jgi:mono/diheme cytochrome c family protein